MIVTIVIVGLALAWLGFESDLLRINLRATVGDFDYDLEAPDDEPDYYNSEDFRETMANLEANIAEELAYQQWLHERYNPEPAYDRKTQRPREGFAERQYRLAHAHGIKENLPQYSIHRRQVDLKTLCPWMQE